ncbi:Pyruvate kinase isozyme A, chloroplastic [Porphyridium purpureum]|uniref:Pyruvate kinase n=1 Tax=Porphyridium purpureum TaxID=35688 RepID=A0A5J4ZAI5_PORPP|nr:Pyruvate kinase isozyme A, chloroplastic [Porphyridium purpureum]|eukprot:POR8214..scf295_1
MYGYVPTCWWVAKSRGAQDAARRRGLGARGAVTRARAARVVMDAAISGSSASRSMAELMDQIPSTFRKSVLSLPSDATIVPVTDRGIKIISTIGPVTSSPIALLRLAAEGTNLFRLNMSHGDYEWHASILESVRDINKTSPFCVGTILDVGSLDMVRLGEFSFSPELSKGDTFTLTIRHEAEYPDDVTEVSYDGFIDVVEEGDLVQVDCEQGMVEMMVRSKTDTDATCEVVTGGKLQSRATLMVRGKSYGVDDSSMRTLEGTCAVGPNSGCHPLSDIDFAIKERVDYISLSFVESQEIIQVCRSYLREQGSNILIVAKIESPRALENVNEIIKAADAIMIARGDLGTLIPFERVPIVQEQIVQKCRDFGKPCLVSTHFLESMTLYPTPTRAEVTDIAEAVSQGCDGMILTSETATGKHPFKALAVMHAVARRMSGELKPLPMPKRMHSENQTGKPGYMAEHVASSAAILANQRAAKAILVFTQKGLMASLVSRNRPMSPIYAFTAAPAIRNKMTILHGVRPFKITYHEDSETTIREAFEVLTTRKLVKRGELVIVVADVLGGSAGAPEDDVERVFCEFSRGDVHTGKIRQGRVRAALRKLGLKASDAVEALLGMRDFDLEESTRMELARSRAGSNALPAEIDSHISYEDFKQYVASATEVVHTVQLRFESVIHAGARLSNCVVGNQCVIHQGVCIGQDGFGFELSTSENDGGGLHRKKPQLLNVVLADSVEVGANSAIDRGSWRDTFIGSGTKIDNLVQVGHNVHIGARCIIAAQCGIGGSVTMGQYVFIGAQVGIHQHKNLGDFAKVAAKSGVMHDIPAHAVYGGYPAMPIKQFHRQSIFMRNSVLEWANQKRADYSRR